MVVAVDGLGGGGGWMYKTRHLETQWLHGGHAVSEGFVDGGEDVVAEERCVCRGHVIEIRTSFWRRSAV